MSARNSVTEEVSKPQHPVEVETDHLKPDTPNDWWYFCDRAGCRRKVPRYEAKYACQECHDFDYCGNCIAEAALIHPGHTFKKVDAPDPLLESNGQFDNTPSSSATKKPRWENACSSCAPIINTLPLLKFMVGPEHRRETSHRNRRRMRFKWNPRLSYLVEATQLGCAFCCWFLQTFFRRFNIESFGYVEQIPWYAKPGSHDKERMKLVEHCMGTLAKLKSDLFEFDVLPQCSRKGANPWDFDKLEFSLGEGTLKTHGKKELHEARVFHSAGVITAERYVFAVKSDPAAEHITSRPPNPSPASSAGLEQLQAWVRNCAENHGSTCRPPITGALPARLLDVSDPTTIRLHQTTPSSSASLPYAALSYCWGGPQPLQTTLSTLDTYTTTGIPLTTLPQTLQDAVLITRHLSIPYLWIDALCIIQDSPPDKFTELARMSDIYKNAFLTIIAARANKATAGFLQNRSDPDTGLWKSLIPVDYPLPNKQAETLEEAKTMPAQELGRIYLMEESSSASSMQKDPVEERAWCLQERVLSPRVVSFGRWATWRCNRVVDCDGGFCGGWGGDDSGDAGVRRLTRALVTGQGTRGDVFRTGQMLETWRGVLQNFTRRKMSLATDRLPAIAGVAREVGRLTGMEYMAGLWKENMLRELMWYARTQEWRTRPAYTNEFPPAPTWSWAAVHAPILCDAVTEDATPLARVVSCAVTEIEGRSTYDVVAGGTVEIQGPFAELEKEDVLAVLKSQNYSPAPPVSNDVQEWYRMMMEHSATQPEYRPSMDDVEAALPEKVFGLMLFERDWTQDKFDKGIPKVMETCYFGLMLQEVEGGRYERIGVFWNDTFEFLDQSVRPWGERTVVLV